MNRLLLTLALVALTACGRSFSAPAHLPLGTVCSSSSACSSGVCASGVCCEASCAPDETCGAPGHLGRCTPRQLGDTCDAGAQCPSTFCADGLCCESACTGPCQWCADPVAPGLCEMVPDNLDPRHACPGTCTSCFAGLCGPAAVGTDPRRECPDQQVCGFDQSCHVTDGGACQADLDCATGRCVQGSCLTVSVETVDVGLSPSASARTVTSVAASAEGFDAVIVQELQSTDLGGGEFQLDEDRLILLYRSPGALWQSEDLEDLIGRGSVEDVGQRFAEALYLGRNLFIVMYEPAPYDDPNNCGTNGFQCGIRAFVVLPDGTLGSAEAVDLGTKDLDSLFARVEPDGSVVVAYADGRGFHARRRALDTHTWTEFAAAPLPSGYGAQTFAPGVLAGQEVFAYVQTDAAGTDAIGFGVVAGDGTPLAQLHGTSFPCAGDLVLGLPSAGQPGSPSFRFSLTCIGPGGPDGSLAGTLDPSGALTFDEVLGNVGDPNQPLGVLPTVFEGPSAPLLGVVRLAVLEDVGLLHPGAADFYPVEHLSGSSAYVGSMRGAAGQAGLPNLAYTAHTSDTVPPLVRLARFRL